MHDYFQRHLDRFRLMQWGRLQVAGSAADAPIREAVRRKVKQLRSPGSPAPLFRRIKINATQLRMDRILD